MTWLISEHERLEAEHLQLQSDYAELEAAFGEMKELNAVLVSDLRAAAPTQPVRYAANLVGPHV